VLPVFVIGIVALYRRAFEEQTVRLIALHPALKYHLEETDEDFVILHIDPTALGRPAALLGFTRDSYRAMVTDLAKLGIAHLPVLS
jgi:hypothetical protein